MPPTVHSDRRRITLTVIGTLLGVAVILGLLYTLLRVGYTQPVAAGRKTDAERAEILAKLRAEDQKALSSYGWVDRGKGIVRIPIAVAMEKVVEETRGEAKGERSTGGAYPSP